MFSAALTLVLLFRMAALGRVSPAQLEALPVQIDEPRATARLAGAVAVRPAAELRSHLEHAFSELGDALSWEVVEEGSLLVTWRGTDAGLSPILLAYEAEAPFVAVLEAAGALLGEGFRPTRTILFAFVPERDAADLSDEVDARGGADPEAGAAALSAYLGRQGIRPAWALVPGSAVRSGAMPGLTSPFAVIGTSERGAASLRITATGADVVGSGPSTRAVAEPVVRISQAISRLESEPFAARVRGPNRELLLTLAPYMDPGTRMLLANLWLLERPVASALAERAGLEPSVRTTVVPVRVWMEEGGDVASNRAFADLAVGIAPWDTPESVLAHVWSKVEDLGLAIAFSEPAPVAPSRVSSSASEGFELVRRAALRTFPDVATAAPGLVEVPTPGRRYEEVAEDVFRFVPVRAGAGSAESSGNASAAGPNELGGATRYMNPTAYLTMIQFYAALIRESAG